jgi:phosphate transport system protein
MAGDHSRVAPNVQYVLSSRYLERIADHATNIAEDVVYWVRGLDVRHGRGLAATGEARHEERLAGMASASTDGIPQRDAV